MEQNHSWDSDSQTSSQKIHRLLLKHKVHYRVHKSPLNSEGLCNISQQTFFRCEELLTHRPAPKMEDHQTHIIVITLLLNTMMWKSKCIF